MPNLERDFTGKCSGTFRKSMRSADSLLDNFFRFCTFTVLLIVFVAFTAEDDFSAQSTADAAF